MQAIHSAACFGQPEVIVELIENLGVDPEEKADVWFGRVFMYMGVDNWCLLGKVCLRIYLSIVKR